MGLQAELWTEYWAPGGAVAVAAGSRRSCGSGSGLQAELRKGQRARQKQQIPGGAVNASLQTELWSCGGDAPGGSKGQQAPGGAAEGKLQAELWTIQRARVRSVEGHRAPGGDANARLQAERWMQQRRSRRIRFTDQAKRAPGGAVEGKLQAELWSMQRAWVRPVKGSLLQAEM